MVWGWWLAGSGGSAQWLFVSGDRVAPVINCFLPVSAHPGSQDYQSILLVPNLTRRACLQTTKSTIYDFELQDINQGYAFPFRKEVSFRKNCSQN
jgi:hypothetical protein